MSNAAPIRAMFFINIAFCSCCITGSAIFQKSCIIIVAGIKNAIISHDPVFAL